MAFDNFSLQVVVDILDIADYKSNKRYDHVTTSDDKTWEHNY